MKEQTAERLSAIVSHALLPLVTSRALFDKSWRHSLPERLGGGGWSTISRASSSEPCIWFHAASVGEVGGLAPVVAELGNRVPELAQRMMISTTSLTGREEALRRGLSGDPPCLLPLDNPYVVRRVLRRATPKIFVAAETEIWPNLFFELHRCSVPIAIINGRISDFSFSRYRRFKHYFKAVLGLVSRVLVQTELDRDRFLELGAISDTVQVVGSTKYDLGLPGVTDRKVVAHSFGLDPDRPVFVAGSVRESEESDVINGYLAARSAVPALQFVIAPRHPQRFDYVARFLAELDVPFSRRSQSRGIMHSVVLLDTIGELRAAYGVADVAFVGGTLVRVGGHNPLEPAAHACPVVVGPYTNNVRDIISHLRAVGGVVEVGDGTELAKEVISLLTDRERHLKIGVAGRFVAEANSGATARVVDSLVELLG